MRLLKNLVISIYIYCGSGGVFPGTGALLEFGAVFQGPRENARDTTLLTGLTYSQFFFLRYIAYVL